MPPMKRPAQCAGSCSLTLTTLARRWQVPRRAVRRLLQRGELSFEEVLGKLRVPLTAIQDYERISRLEVRRTSPTPRQKR
jgi:hypothetical protein